LSAGKNRYISTLNLPNRSLMVHVNFVADLDSEPGSRCCVAKAEAKHIS
jgi:hypothetical protein